MCICSLNYDFDRGGIRMLPETTTLKTFSCRLYYLFNRRYMSADKEDPMLRDEY